MSHNQRLVKYIKFARLSPREFSQGANIEYNKFNKYINGSTKNPGVNVVVAVLNTYKDLSARWWLCGEGEMLKGKAVPDGMVLIPQKRIDYIESETKQYLIKATLALEQHTKSLKEINELNLRIVELEQEVELLKKEK